MDNSHRSTRSYRPRDMREHGKGRATGNVMQFDDFECADDSFCAPSPTKWICESFDYGFSPTNKILLKGSRTSSTITRSSVSGVTSMPSSSDLSDSSHHSNSQTARKDNKPNTTEAPHMNAHVPRVVVGDIQRIPGGHGRHDSVEIVADHSSVASSRSGASCTTRIIAPNVKKLSLGSVVEILLEKDMEGVAVLCSVDVLKMRSQLFQDLLLRQEADMTQASGPPPANEVWRRSLLMEEESPYEAAAFLESLHEGRGVVQGEWNLSWARLSVLWKVEELEREYALMIARHVDVLLSTASNLHWRTHPDALVGMRIAVFRKNTSSIPSVTMGYVIQSSASTGPSHVRVSFEAARGPGAPAHLSPSSSSARTCSSNGADGIRIVGSHGEIFPSPSAHKRWETVTADRREVPPPSKKAPAAKPPSTPGMESSPHVLSSSKEGLAAPLVGEVSTPFWVQNGEGVSWMDPDDYCAREINDAVSQSDKITLWEMITVVLQHPSLVVDEENGLHGVEFSHLIRNAQDVADTFKKKEYRALWTPEAADTLPLETCAELIRFVYNGDAV